MRKMNKIVALSLVLAMALSMMASAASFKDQATINEDLIADIDLMVALNVFSEDGTGAGYFEPNVELTRAQVAKLVYVLKNKGNDNGATGWTNMDIFTDVEVGSWYEGYVNYCASVGMIAGAGDGTFNPNGKMTAVEFAKLLLVLIGYKADVEGYTGNNWDNNILEDAEAAGIFVDYELPIRSTVTREWAAKLMTNAIYANKARYILGELIITTDTFANVDLGLDTIQAIAMGTTKFTLNETGDPALDEDGTTSAIKLNDGSTPRIKYEISEALLGQKVNVVYKKEAGKTLAESKIYGVVANEESDVYEVAADKITVGSGTNAGKIKFAGYMNDDYVLNHSVKAYNNMHFIGDRNISTLKVNSNAIIRFVDNDSDDNIEYAFFTTPVIGTVQAHKPANEQLTIVCNNAGDNVTLTSSSTGFTYENVQFNDEIVKDDIVAGIYDFSTGVKTLILDKVEPFTATVSQVNTTVDGSGNTVVASNVINGTTYKLAHNALTGTTLKATAGTTEYDFYVVDGYIVATENVTVIPTNIALVIDEQNGQSLTAPKVKVILADGTVGVYDYKNVSGWAQATGGVLPADIMPHKVMEYKLTDGQISLRNLVNGGGITYETDDNTTALINAARTYNIGGQLVKIEDNAFFFLKNSDNEYSVVKGSEVESAGIGAIKMTAYNDDAIAKVMFGYIQADSVGATTSATYAFITGNAYATDDDGTAIWWVNGRDKNGAEITFQVNSVTDEPSGTSLEEKINSLKNGIVAYTILDGKADLTFVDAALDIGTGYAQGSISAVEGNVVAIGGALYTIADDCVINNVDMNTSNKPVWVEGDLIVEAVSSANNVIFKTKGTSGTNATIISEIIVEVNGEAIQF